MTINEHCIRSADDVAALAAWARRRRIRRIRVEAGATAPSQRIERLSAAINRDLRACGCFEAALLCLVALLSTPFAGSALWPDLPDHWIVLAAIGFGYLLAAAAVGKIGGLMLAQWRLSRNLRLMQALLHKHAAVP
jgi:hypothetical protein